MPASLSAWQQFARFAVVGLANTVAGFAVIVAATVILGLHDVAANALGYAVGLAIGFAANRRWTFAHRGRLAPAIARFLLAFAASWLANLLTLLALRHGLGLPPLPSQALAIVPYTLTFFVLSRSFVFRIPARPAPALHPPSRS